VARPKLQPGGLRKFAGWKEGKELGPVAGVCKGRAARMCSLLRIDYSALFKWLF
jgi:hypothetical protein